MRWLFVNAYRVTQVSGSHSLLNGCIDMEQNAAATEPRSPVSILSAGRDTKSTRVNGFFFPYHKSVFGSAAQTSAGIFM